METFAAFFEQGGDLLWAILLASVLMWTVILERYWFLFVELPRLTSEWLGTWKDRASMTAFQELRLRDSLTAQHLNQTSRGLKIIDILTQVLPLLGLLGTVSGMIKVFDVINLFGAGNARGMAAGISEALITTMAGLLTALSGLFFASDLVSRTERLRDRFFTRLSEARGVRDPHAP